MIRRSAATTIALSLALLPLVARAEEPPRDPLELRLDASGLTDPELARTTGGAPRILDAELHVTSHPDGLGLLATRQLEAGRGVERPVCRAPCTAYLEHGSYRFTVETRHGRDRDVPSTYSIYNDGTLELRIQSRFWLRFGLYSTSAVLVGAGIALYATHFRPQRSSDPTCYPNCTHYTSSQVALMSIGGVMAMFGGITVRYAIAARDIGHVEYHAAPHSHHQPVPE